MRVVVLGFVCLALVQGCRKEVRPTEGSSAEDKPKNAEVKDAGTLRTLDVTDGFAYASGHYGNSHNHPVIFALVGEKKLVMMARSGRGELPLSDTKAALTSYEALLLDNGYSPNGKAQRDDKTYVMDGGKMVVVPFDKLFRKMSAEERAKFTSEQLALLGQTTSSDLHLQFAGHNGDRAEVPAMWAHSKSLEVVGKGFRREFPIAQASAAFEEYEALLKRAGAAP